jgi:hypothetical protein
MHRRDRLHIIGPDLDGRPIARCCDIAAGEASYAYRTAYEEAFSCYSPGVMAELDITDPDNVTLNRLWKERRTMQSVVVGSGAWGELWVSMLPMMRWAKRRIATTTHAISRSVLRISREPAQPRV